MMESWGSVLQHAPPFGFAFEPMPWGRGRGGWGLNDARFASATAKPLALTACSCFLMFVSVVHAVDKKMFEVRIVEKPSAP